MKYILASVFALLPTLALAHPGHTEVVSGHSHTLMDLVAYGAIPVIVFLAFVGVFAFARRGNK